MPQAYCMKCRKKAEEIYWGRDQRARELPCAVNIAMDCVGRLIGALGAPCVALGKNGKEVLE